MWVIVESATKDIQSSRRTIIRQTSKIGLIGVFFLELLYVVPLGIVFMAYQGVEM